MFHLQNNLTRDLILVGDSLLSAVAFPGMALAKRMAHGSSKLPLGIVMTVVGAPVTVPALLAFGPALLAYSQYFHVKEIRAEREQEQRRMRREE